MISGMEGQAMAQSIVLILRSKGVITQEEWEKMLAVRHDDFEALKRIFPLKEVIK